ncbi:unnamed protein product [Sphagnum tenellum]
MKSALVNPARLLFLLRHPTQAQSACPGDGVAELEAIDLDSLSRKYDSLMLSSIITAIKSGKSPRETQIGLEALLDSNLNNLVEYSGRFTIFSALIKDLSEGFDTLSKKTTIARLEKPDFVALVFYALLCITAAVSKLDSATRQVTEPDQTGADLADASEDNLEDEPESEDSSANQPSSTHPAGLPRLKITRLAMQIADYYEKRFQDKYQIEK